MPWPSSGSRTNEPERTSQSGYALVPDPGTDDAALVAAARANRQALRFLYDRHVQPIYAYCYVQTTAAARLAEDATSEIFFKALARPEQLSRRPLRCLAVPDRPAHRHRRATAQPPGTDPTFRSTSPARSKHPNNRSRSASRTTVSWTGCARPSANYQPDQRAVLELQIAGLAPQEIATTLGRSLNAVRHLRFRAFRQLRQTLAVPTANADRGVHR